MVRRPKLSNPGDLCEHCLSQGDKSRKLGDGLPSKLRSRIGSAERSRPLPQSTDYRVLRPCAHENVEYSQSRGEISMRYFTELHENVSPSLIHPRSVPRRPARRDIGVAALSSSLRQPTNDSEI